MTMFPQTGFSGLVKKNSESSGVQEVAGDSEHEALMETSFS